MGTIKHLRIGVYIPTGAQLLDLSAVDLFGMMTPEYLTACSLPSPMIAAGTPATFHYIAVPKAGPHVDLTASAILKITKTIKDPEVQPGELDILLVPGPDPSLIFDEETLDFLRVHAKWKGTNGEMVDILCICTGALMLGQSGILKGKRASGPRALVPLLKKKFPETQWVNDKRWVIDGNIWSSGGITNGLEMVAEYMRQKFPGPASDAALAMADVGGKGIDYETGTTRETLWWLWQILRAVTMRRTSDSKAKAV